MTDIEYTVLRINEIAKKIVAMTNKPEFGLSSWFFTLDALMAQLAELEVTQQVPKVLVNVSYQDALNV